MPKVWNNRWHSFCSASLTVKDGMFCPPLKLVLTMSFWKQAGCENTKYSLVIKKRENYTLY